MADLLARLRENATAPAEENRTNAYVDKLLTAFGEIEEEPHSRRETQEPPQRPAQKPAHRH